MICKYSKKIFSVVVILLISSLCASEYKNDESASNRNQSTIKYKRLHIDLALKENSSSFKQTTVVSHDPIEDGLMLLLLHCIKTKKNFNMESAKKLLLPLLDDHLDFIHAIKYTYQVPQDIAETIYQSFKQSSQY